MSASSIEDTDAAAAIFEELGMELNGRGAMRGGFADHHAARRPFPHRTEARPLLKRRRKSSGCVNSGASTFRATIRSSRRRLARQTAPTPPRRIGRSTW